MRRRVCGLLLAGAVASVGACRPPTTTQVHTLEVSAPAAPTAAAPGPAEILSAHFAVDEAPPLGGDDALPVVFSAEIDAASLVPEAFVVAREDGSRARPREAVLAPASEDDENRTVLLVGEFGGPHDNPPRNVAVIGALYTEDGRPLRHVAAEVLAFDVAPTVVFAEARAPAAGRCADAGAMVRTYWQEGLRGVEPEDLAAVTVERRGGGETTPFAFDDHALDAQGGEDNVLDLCLRGEEPPVRLRVRPGAFADPAGHVNAAVDIDVGERPV